MRIPMLLKSISASFPLLILGASLASAQSQPAPSTAGHLEILGFTLGRSTLAEVEAKLGKSAARKCSHEEEASKEVCYLAGKGQTRVVFEAGFSGGWMELDGYKLIAASLQPPCYRQCPRVAQVTSDVQTQGGLKLG